MLDPEKTLDKLINNFNSECSNKLLTNGQRQMAWQIAKDLIYVKHELIQFMHSKKEPKLNTKAE